MRDLVVLGGGGHARVVLAMLDALTIRATGYVAPQRSEHNLEIAFLGTDEEWLAQRGSAGIDAVIGIGKIDAGDARLLLMRRLESVGVGFPAFVEPTASLHPDVRLGAGSVVLTGAAVIVGTRLGCACIVNTSATIDHECDIGDDVHIAPGAVLAGGVTVGSHSLVGVGARVLPGLRISERTIVGAGAVVTRDIQVPGIYAGVPARRIA